MRSNSGDDQSRNNMRDPTVRDRTEQRKKRSDRSHISHARAPGRPPRRPKGLAKAIIIRDAVEREAQHELTRARRPAERGFGVAHPLARADHAPQDVG